MSEPGLDLAACVERVRQRDEDAARRLLAHLYPLVLKLVLRESDVVSRLDGDSFAVMMPETDRDSALRCADRVRRALEEHRFRRAGHLTASVGVAACPTDGGEAVELLDAAERALTLAKKNGRRRVMVAARGAMH